MFFGLALETSILLLRPVRLLSMPNVTLLVRLSQAVDARYTEAGPPTACGAGFAPIWLATRLPLTPCSEVFGVGVSSSP